MGESARTRIAAGLGLRRIHAQKLRNGADPVLRQQFQPFFHNAHRVTIEAVSSRQLQNQAFLQIPRTDARRIQALDNIEHLRQFKFIRPQQLRRIRQRFPEKTMLVQHGNQMPADLLLRFTQRIIRQLKRQIILQRFGLISITEKVRRRFPLCPAR